VTERIFAVLYVPILGLTRCYKTTAFSKPLRVSHDHYHYHLGVGYHSGWNLIWPTWIQNLSILA